MSTESVESYKKYKLHIVQNPIRARCCGLGEKDKRPIDPPPILKLTAENQYGDSIELAAKDAALFLVHCQLYDQDSTHEKTLIQSPWSNTLTTNNQQFQQSFPLNNKPENVRNLIGSVICNAYSLHDENSIPGIYFIFQDLSIRLEGAYTLKFIFINLEERHIDSNTKIQTEIISQPFTVYSAKKFPGMTESTSLSRCFAKQGIKIPIRMAIQKPAFSHQSVNASSFNRQTLDSAFSSNTLSEIKHSKETPSDTLNTLSDPQPCTKNPVSYKLSIKHLLISTSDTEEESLK
ncbi:unnamed protein product [Rhizopus stolonifer]